MDDYLESINENSYNYFENNEYKRCNENIKSFFFKFDSIREMNLAHKRFRNAIISRPKRFQLQEFRSYYLKISISEYSEKINGENKIVKRLNYDRQTNIDSLSGIKYVKIHTKADIENILFEYF